MTSRWFRDIKPRRNRFINDRDYNSLWLSDFSAFIVNIEKTEFRRIVGVQTFVARRLDMRLMHIHLRSVQAVAGLLQYTAIYYCSKSASGGIWRILIFDPKSCGKDAFSSI
jgi:hypothetical protein